MNCHMWNRGGKYWRGHWKWPAPLFIWGRKGTRPSALLLRWNDDNHRRRWRYGIEGGISWKSIVWDGEYNCHTKGEDLVMEIFVTEEAKWQNHNGNWRLMDSRNVFIQTYAKCLKGEIFFKPTIFHYLWESHWPIKTIDTAIILLSTVLHSSIHIQIDPTIVFPANI